MQRSSRGFHAFPFLLLAALCGPSGAQAGQTKNATELVYAWPADLSARATVRIEGRRTVASSTTGSW